MFHLNKLPEKKQIASGGVMIRKLKSVNRNGWEVAWLTGGEGHNQPGNRIGSGVSERSTERSHRQQEKL